MPEELIDDSDEMIFPSRVVCLCPGSTDTVRALGAGDRMTAADADGGAVALAGVPDLVISFAGVPCDAGVLAGVPLLALRPMTLGEVMDGILLVGRILGNDVEAMCVVERLAAEVRDIRERGRCFPRRPRVFFEEQSVPLSSGGRWIGELVGIAGGENVFAKRSAPGGDAPVVESADVVRQDPEIIFAAAPGGGFDAGVIRRRRGWETIGAVREGRIHGIAAADILAPGPSLIKGLQQMHDFMAAVVK
ncbi:MAG: ABC transporter substrate-binding protein [Planctomycetota bacterium]